MGGFSFGPYTGAGKLAGNTVPGTPASGRTSASDRQPGVKTPASPSRTSGSINVRFMGARA
ncbi:hypothetical protein GCM10022406_38690 [Hymenobacter algoricola]|uniref:Uncharacterized protein n=1 Tax=Hymenobacter algoricola TaxID=486267 RepID=A0ABP7NSH2_9BACT